jgi:hypothetical protein
MKRNCVPETVIIGCRIIEAAKKIYRKYRRR